MGIKHTIYSALRLLILPIEKIDEATPKKGKIIDYGCGYGVTSIYLALSSNKRKITGIEHNEERIKSAQIGGKQIKNLSFFKGSIVDMKFHSAKAHLLIDVLHHLPYKQQIILLNNILKVMGKDDIIIIKELGKKPFFKYLWNYVHDKIMTFNEPLFFRDEKWFVTFFKRIGIKIKLIKCENFFYSHFIAVARR